MKIEIYLDDGRVFSYDLPNEEKIREHAAAIITGGYRHSSRDGDYWEWYPPHRITKVKGPRLSSKYYDECIGT